MIQSVQRALTLLEILDQAGPEGMALVELADRADLKTPTAHNLLNTLVALNYAGQCSTTRRYTLGPASLTLGKTQSTVDRVRQAATGLATMLQKQVNETVILALYADRGRHSIISIESEQILRVGAQRGIDANFFTTATGRVLLSLLPEKELSALLDEIGLPEGEWSGVTSRETLQTALEEIRETGVAIYKKGMSHVVALAVPVETRDPALCLALGLYYPSVRDCPERRVQLEKALHQTSLTISTELERT